jgi:hypothetical protein
MDIRSRVIVSACMVIASVRDENGIKSSFSRQLHMQALALTVLFYVRCCSDP